MASFLAMRVFAGFRLGWLTYPKHFSSCFWGSYRLPVLSKTPQKSEEELCKEAVDVSEDKEMKEEQHDRSLSVSHYHSVVCQRLILQRLL